ncbi:MAG TPA: extracellular solute-binding protein [Opitutaceae bacterium]|nr:extracellular solute-binding protein [Opitutaceae bacterium]
MTASPAPHRVLKLSLVAALTLTLVSGCAKKETVATRDIGPEAEAYYKAHPDVFHFATPADLPKDLIWHDGHDVPEFSAPEAKRGGTFNFFISDFPRTLRFVGPDASGSFRSFILDDNALTLTQKQPNTSQYFPGLAKAWAYSSDRKTMYFKLDPDARYSDGVPVKADDYFFAFFFFRSRYIDDPWQVNFYTTYYTNLTKYDNYTISASWRDAIPDLDDKLGGLAPVPKHFYKDLGDDYLQRYQWKIEPTTGPYTVKPEDLHKGSFVDLTRVPNWWAGDKPFYRHRYNFDRIHLQVIRETDKAFEAFKRGDLDSFGLSLPKFWYDKLPDNDPLVQKGYICKTVFYNQIPVPTWGLYINTAMPLLGNREVREGIAWASNFDLIDRQYYRGDFVRMQTGSDGYAEVPFPGIHPRPFSVDKALEHFAKAGFTKRGPDGILVNAQGQRLSFTLTTGYDIMRDVLTILRQEAAKAGLELNIEILDDTTADKKIEEKHHQIAFIAFSPSVEKYPRYWETYHSSNANKPQTNNFTNTADPETDKLIDAYDKAQTMDEIRRLAQQLEQGVHDNAAFIPAFKMPFYRVGYWRWIKWPKEFDVRLSQYSWQYGLEWIDEDAKKETLDARDSGKTFPPEIQVYDQWKTANQ